MAGTAPLQPGPLRDALGHLTSARRGGEWVDCHWMSARTGVPYVNMRERLHALVQYGLAAVVTEARGELYQATELGQEMIDRD